MTDPTNTDNTPPALRLIVTASAGARVDPTATQNADPGLRLVVPPVTPQAAAVD